MARQPTSELGRSSWPQWSICTENSRTLDFKDKPCSEGGAGSQALESFLVLTLRVLKPELPAPSLSLSFGS